MQEVWRAGLLAVCCVVVVACEPSVEPRESQGQEVTGRLVLLDDTGMAPRPAEGGVLLLVPDRSSAALWYSVPDGKPPSMRNANFEVSETTVDMLDGDLD